MREPIIAYRRENMNGLLAVLLTGEFLAEFQFPLLCHEFVLSRGCCLERAGRYAEIPLNVKVVDAEGRSGKSRNATWDA